MRNKKGQFMKNHKHSSNWEMSLPRGKKHYLWKPKIKKVCVVCGKEFEVHPCRKNVVKYCSILCLYKRSKILKKCIVCNKDFFVAPSSKNRKYCSKKCQGISIQKENHWNWKGGIDEDRSRFYYSAEWKIKRAEIFKRDNYSCVLCGSHKNLEVHHIYPYSKFPELKLYNENLITLCHQCHQKQTAIFHPNKWRIIYENSFI